MTNGFKSQNKLHVFSKNKEPSGEDQLTSRFLPAFQSAAEGSTFKDGFNLGHKTYTTIGANAKGELAFYQNTQIAEIGSSDANQSVNSFQFTPDWKFLTFYGDNQSTLLRSIDPETGQIEFIWDNAVFEWAGSVVRSWFKILLKKTGPDTFSYQRSVDPDIFQTEEFPNYISKDHIAPTVSLKYSDTFVAAFDSAASPLQSDTINNIIDADHIAISNPSTNPNGETISQDLQTPLPHKEDCVSDDKVMVRSEGSVATSFTEIETDLVADKMTT